MSTLARCLFAVLLVASVPALCIAAEAPQASSATEVITLPKYDITADRVLPPIEKWHYVSIPGFEILSNASARNTRLFVEDFYLLRQVCRIILPSLKEKATCPTYIVLCGRGNAFDAFLPDRKQIAPPSLFIADAERSAIVINFTFESVDGGFRGLLDSGANDPFYRFYIQYFRQLLRNSIKPAAPAWLEEGLVQIFAAVEFSPRSIVVGRVGGTSASRTAEAVRMTQPANAYTRVNLGLSQTIASGDGLDTSPDTQGKMGSFNRILERRALLPMDRLFNFDLGKSTSEERFTFCAQAYLFTHLCLYGRNHRFANPLFRLVDAASRGALNEDVFRACFGKSYRQMEAEMRGYVLATDHQAVEFRFKKGSELERAPEFTLRDATDAESSRIAGEVLRLAGHKEEAINRLIAPYVRGHYDADLLAALGLAELSRGNEARGRRFLEAAVKADTSRARAYTELAQLRFGELQKIVGDGGRDLTTEEALSVQSPLYQSLKHPPVAPATYDLLARTWYLSSAPPTKEQFIELAAGAEEHCKNLGLVFRVAALGLKHGYVEDSRRFIAYGLEYSEDNATRYRFQELAKLLPSEPRTLSGDRPAEIPASSSATP